MWNDPSEDFYALLGIEASAEQEELRHVWRKLARRWHPDRAGAEATAMFQKISAAYAVLADPLARAAYDRRRGATLRQPAHRPSRDTSSPPRPARRAPSVMLSRASGPLNTLLNCGIAGCMADGTIELFLNAQEAAQGGMVTISMRVPVRKAQSIVEELFSAWLAVPPTVEEGTVLSPSVLLPDMLRPVRFCIRIHPARAEPQKTPEPARRSAAPL